MFFLFDAWLKPETTQEDIYLILWLFLKEKIVCFFSHVDRIFPPIWSLITVFAPYHCASVSLSTTLSDNVVSAVLPLHRLAVLLSEWGRGAVGHKRGEKKAWPLPHAEPGLSEWPLARGGFKRVGARGSSHSHGRTSQEHQSKVSPCPSTQPTPPRDRGPNPLPFPLLRIHTHIKPPKHRRHTLGLKAQLKPQVAEINCGKISTAWRKWATR